MAKRKKKPAAPRKIKSADPAHIARVRAEDGSIGPFNTWGVNEDALRLDANDAVRTEAATRHKERRIRRFDAFALLHSRGALSDAQLATVRRMQTDLAKLHAVSGERQGQGGGGSISGLNAFMASRIDGNETLHSVLGSLGPLSVTILAGLVDPDIIEGRQINWRATVERITGEHRPMAQSALVVAACENLVRAYQDEDNKPRKRAA